MAVTLSEAVPHRQLENVGIADKVLGQPYRCERSKNRENKGTAATGCSEGRLERKRMVVGFTVNREGVDTPHKGSGINETGLKHMLASWTTMGVLCNLVRRRFLLCETYKSRSPEGVVGIKRDNPHKVLSTGPGVA